MFSDINDIYADFDNLVDNDKFVLLYGSKRLRLYSTDN